MAPEAKSSFSAKDRELLTRMDTKLERVIADVANLANNFATKEELATVKTEVDKIADTNKWLVRLIIGSVILAGLGLILVKTQ